MRVVPPFCFPHSFCLHVMCIPASFTDIRPFVCSCCLLIIVGCSADRSVSDNVGETSASTVAAVEPDDADSLSALQTAGAKTKEASSGLVVEIDFRGTNIDDDLIRKTGRLRHVSSLILAGTAANDTTLAALAGTNLPLVCLDLRGCSITNDGLQHLSGFSNLKVLRFNGSDGQTTVDDAGMPHLASLKNLRVLALDGLWVSEVGLESLTEISGLTELYMKSTTISDDGLKLLTNFPQLKKLRLAFNQISDAGLEHLAALKSLEDLDLSENSLLTDAGLTHLAGLTNLKKLNLWRVQISDAGIHHLSGLHDLEWLNLDNTQLSDNGLPALMGLTKLTFLHLGSTTVSDTGMVHLQGLTNLRDLKVTRTAVTESGVTNLQKKLPETKIQLKYIEGQ